ncbi:MAG: hypothetical protein QNJ45_06630 [Ardenticatenaceae bacterium]|nr:hypothetical protein [Ardenticatenaceae bacterium]
MAKKKIVLSEQQKAKNEEILLRIERERTRLWEETRAMQDKWNDHKRRRRKKN